jgi:hypothetical protein
MKNNQQKPYDSSKSAGSQDKSASQNRPGFEKSAGSSKVTTGYDKAQPKQASTSHDEEDRSERRNESSSRR